MQSNVSIEDKLSVLQAHYRPIMDELGALAVGNDVTADDVIELFAMGIAAIIDNDSHLTTPRHLRQAAESAGKLIEQRSKDFRALNSTTGVSVFRLLLSDYPIGNAVQQAA